VLALLVGTTCSTGNAEFAVPEPVPPRALSEIATHAGPPADAFALLDDGTYPTYLVAALGLDRVVVGAFQDTRPGEFVVGDIDEGGWQPTAPPPIPDGIELEPEMLTVGHDVVLIGAPCPGPLNVEADTSPTCPAGYEGIRVWRLDHRDLRWSTLEGIYAGELGIPNAPPDPNDGDSWFWTVLGATEDSVLVSLSAAGHRVVAIGMDGTIDVPLTWLGLSYYPVCLTGSGVAIGLATSADRLSQRAGRLTDVGRVGVALLRPGARDWTPLPGTFITEVQGIVCGQDQFAAVGEATETLGAAEWRAFDDRGRPVPSTLLDPAAALPTTTSPSDVSFFVRYRQRAVGEGTSHPAVVRDFGNLSGWVRPAPHARLERVRLPRRIVVVVGPNGPVLVAGFRTGRRVIAEGSTQLPDGRVAVLVRVSRDYGAGDADDDLRLVVATGP